MEPAVFLAEPVLDRHPAVLEHQLRRVRRPPAQLVELAADTVAGGPAFDHQDRKALMAALRLRPHQDDHQIGIDAVGDEHLGAGDDVGITVAAGDALHVRDVRATRRLRHAERDDLLALDRGRQPALALCVVAVLIDGRRRNRDMSADACRDPPGTAAGELLEKDGLVNDAGVRAAVLLGVLQAQKIQGAESLEQLARKLLGLFPLIDVWADLLVDEATDGASELLVLRCEEVRTRHA